MENKKRKITIHGKEIEYTLKKVKNSKSVRLAIHADGCFVITAPKWYPVYVINKFIEEKSQWIWDKVQDVDFVSLAQKKKMQEEHYRRSIDLARAVVASRLEFFNRHYHFSYNRVSIKNQKTCWGSCSQKGNLNFNYNIINLSEQQRDYVIVHELCHLQELNHGQKFWRLVAEAVPDYRQIRQSLKKIIN
jgi:predicted metal-dependent hydrolase